MSEDLKNIRKSFIKNLIVTFFIISPIAILFGISFFNKFEFSIIGNLFVSFFMLIISWHVAVGIWSSKYNSLIKTKFFKSFLEKYLDKNQLIYKPNECINYEHVKSSTLVNVGCRVEGEDFISFIYNDHKTEISDISCFAKDNTELDNGIFINTEMNFMFNDILRITNKTLTDKFNQKDTDNWNDITLNRINLESETLTENYNIFSTNVEWARTILTENFIKALTKLTDSYVTELFIHKNKLYIFINRASLQFESQNILKQTILEDLDVSINKSIEIVKETLNEIEPKLEKLT